MRKLIAEAALALIVNGVSTPGVRRAMSTHEGSTQR
jgi:hypothetical protein